MTAPLTNLAPAILFGDDSKVIASSPFPVDWPTLQQRFGQGPVRAGLAERFIGWVLAAGLAVWLGSCGQAGSEPVKPSATDAEIEQGMEAARRAAEDTARRDRQRLGPALVAAPGPLLTDLSDRTLAAHIVASACVALGCSFADIEQIAINRGRNGPAVLYFFRRVDEPGPKTSSGLNMNGYIRCEMNNPDWIICGPSTLERGERYRLRFDFDISGAPEALVGPEHF